MAEKINSDGTHGHAAPRSTHRALDAHTDLARLSSNIESVLGRVQCQLGELSIRVDLELSSDRAISVGPAQARAKMIVRSAAAARNLLSLREDRLAESYLRGELDLEGSLREILKTRRLLRAGHGASWLARFIVPALIGRAAADRAAIRAHYDLDPSFYLSFLDPNWPAYSQGIYLDETDTLSRAIEQKFEFATRSCKIDRDTSVLEVGPGWGAFMRYLLPRGPQITAITNSSMQRKHLADMFSSPRVTLVEGDFFSYQPAKKFDALTMMGVLEHLPRYGHVCRKLRAVLEPGGYAYIDASATEVKYSMPAFIYRHVYPYDHSFMHLPSFLKAAEREKIQVVSLDDDSKNYKRTLAAWAANFESARRQLERCFEPYDVRRFRLYLWGSLVAFEEENLQCYRLVLRMPR
jgi:cyclopropane-fatty-acyl-phospholipid synthase